MGQLPSLSSLISIHPLVVLFSYFSPFRTKAATSGVSLSGGYVSVSPTPIASGGSVFPFISTAGQLTMEAWVNPSSLYPYIYPMSVSTAAVGTCSAGRCPSLPF